MGENAKVRFGKYIESLRKERGKSLRETAKAIKVSPQFLSEVEKGRKSTLTTERIEKLANFLLLSPEEYHDLTALSAKAREGNDVLMPQDCADFAVNDFVVEACRLSKETGAGEAEWKILLDELRARKEL
ncbi:MAG: helix-turn-helix domain-containing protein [Prevotella sp.]|nr:helix-turn-helix domain-containing protein [Prevotella sp.]